MSNQNFDPEEADGSRLMQVDCAKMRELLFGRWGVGVRAAGELSRLNHSRISDMTGGGKQGNGVTYKATKQNVNLVLIAARKALNLTEDQLSIGDVEWEGEESTKLDKRNETTVLRSYEYISDAKVNAVIGQMRSSIEEQNRYKRLRIAENFIRKTCPVGGLTKPDVWIAGVVHAKYGFLGRRDEVIAYGGLIEDGCFILAGSSAHLDGEKPAGAFGLRFSYLPRLVSALGRADMILEGALCRPAGSNEGMLQMASGKGDTLERNWNHFIQHGWRDFEGPEVKIEFLAKRLLDIGREGRRSILATPLYVCMAE